MFTTVRVYTGSLYYLWHDTCQTSQTGTSHTGTNSSRFPLLLMTWYLSDISNRYESYRYKFTPVPSITYDIWYLSDILNRYESYRYKFTPVASISYDMIPVRHLKQVRVIPVQIHPGSLYYFWHDTCQTSQTGTSHTDTNSSRLLYLLEIFILICRLISVSCKLGETLSHPFYLQVFRLE